MANFDYHGGERTRDVYERADYPFEGSKSSVWIVLGAVILVIIGIVMFSVDHNSAPNGSNASAPTQQTGLATSGAPAPAKPGAPAQAPAGPAQPAQ